MSLQNMEAQIGSIAGTPRVLNAAMHTAKEKLPRGGSRYSHFCWPNLTLPQTRPISTRMITIIRTNPSPPLAVVPPGAAVRPRGQRPNQQKDQNDNQNRTTD